jgi:hypothetical protein
MTDVVLVNQTECEGCARSIPYNLFNASVRLWANLSNFLLVGATSWLTSNSFQGVEYIPGDKLPCCDGIGWTGA